MKKRLIGFLFGAMLISMCVGCGAKSTTSEQPETATEITIEESTTEQTEATSTPEETAKKGTMPLLNQFIHKATILILQTDMRGNPVLADMMRDVSIE